jgi:hypothetical protein
MCLLNLLYKKWLVCSANSCKYSPCIKSFVAKLTGICFLNNEDNIKNRLNCVVQKIRNYFILAISIVLLLNLLCWLFSHASGHKIPLQTDLSFAIVTCVLVLLIIVTRLYQKIEAVYITRCCFCATAFFHLSCAAPYRSF